MAGNAYSTYTGNVMMTPPGQQALIAQPTVAGSNNNTGAGGNPNSKARTSIQATTANLGGQSGFRSPFGNWNQTK